MPFWSYINIMPTVLLFFKSKKFWAVRDNEKWTSATLVINDHLVSPRNQKWTLSWVRASYSTYSLATNYNKMKSQSKFYHTYEQNTENNAWKAKTKVVRTTCSVGSRKSQLTVLLETVFTNYKKSSFHTAIF